MEAALVTVYIVSLRFTIFNSKRVSSIRRRFLDAARGSLHDMFLGAVVLSLGVLVAAALGRKQRPSKPVAAEELAQVATQKTGNATALAEPRDHLHLVAYLGAQPDPKDIHQRHLG
ncbi:hypothetical protein SLS62_007414 [Diatrype stigma]|uniref:Uncharacterized protein n=1 Tax=Diatrype stigma TaxID=117547 RepID=A0AAN9ULE9_9PEZI